MEFREWFWAVVSVAWQGWTGVALVVAGYLQQIFGWFHRPWKWTGLAAITAGALLFLYASYSAWDDEHRQRVALQSPAPQFNGAITAVADIMPRKGNADRFLSPYSYGVIADVWIEDDGGPSAVNDWVASAKTTTGEKVRGDVFLSPLKTIIFPGTGRGQEMGIVYGPGTSIVRLSGTTVATNIRVNGVVVVGFHQTVVNTSLRLGLQDRTRKWTVIGFNPAPLEPLP